jgi:hypothetical protein
MIPRNETGECPIATIADAVICFESIVEVLHLAMIDRVTQQLRVLQPPNGLAVRWLRSVLITKGASHDVLAKLSPEIVGLHRHRGVVTNRNPRYVRDCRWLGTGLAIGRIL